MNTSFTKKENLVSILNEKSKEELEIYKSKVNDSGKFLIDKIKRMKENEVVVGDNMFHSFVKKYPFNFVENDRTGTMFSMFANDIYRILHSLSSGRGIYLGRLTYDSTEGKFSIPFDTRFSERSFILENAKPRRIGWNNFKIFALDENKNKILLVEFKVNNFVNLINMIRSFIKDVYVD